MSRISFRIENTRSNSGKHRRIAKAFIVNENGEVLPIKISSSWSCKGVYSRGESRCVHIDVEDNLFVVLIELTINWRKHVKGYINVKNSDGLDLLKVKYIRGRLRYVSGDREAVHLIKNILKYVEAELK
ncbi:hypothetical protein QPL79_00245 [Ignisphaera sp. 4213-co]|uniref:Uncharacterized protein n=1 Tax=Ignisphaera cupida TaxID=3050454 RepID=A0ABD4Z6R2_9CREN|nr:hypothetical protein [Ignisphaera sp. 4213-co]MDK6027803.1 hypothetical protein [Ignisphaera sp. 4213-co]